jgi:hypothetical protein
MIFGTPYEMPLLSPADIFCSYTLENTLADVNISSLDCFRVYHIHIPLIIFYLQMTLYFSTNVEVYNSFGVISRLFVAIVII